MTASVNFSALWTTLSTQEFGAYLCTMWLTENEMGQYKMFLLRVSNYV